MSSNGAPLWPIGISGSIAHSHVHIAVISARVQDYRSLGIDIDDGRDLEGAVVDIATAPELQRVMEAYSVDVNAAARLAFSAKEALFKCQAPITSMESLVFLDVALQPRVDGSMAALLQVPIEPQAAVAISAISIFFECFQGVRLAIATLPPA
jgi:4'-phosphopantetheinyl transferase EntD